MLDKKTPAEIEILRQGGNLLGEILRKLGKMVEPGCTGLELNAQAEKLIKSAGGEAAFKNYRGFPYALCVSVNSTVVHGLPSSQAFKEGDVVGLDIGLKYQGLYTDTAMTVGVGKISKEAERLIKTTKQSLTVALNNCGPDYYIGDIGKAIEKYIKPFGYGIVRELAGHGVGRAVHEEPWIPNFDSGNRIAKMFPGLVLAIEPMIILGGDHRIIADKQGWNIKALDGTLTAHFEHTVAITEKGYIILTQ